MARSEKERLEYHINGIMKNDERSSLQIERPVYQIEELNRDHLYEKPYSTLKSSCMKACGSVKLGACLKKTVPVLSWLPEYNWKKSFSGDIVSGLTVAIMHIPQGMAYGLLGGVPPVVGIYMAFFPVLVYFIFGTSRHVSMGTFAIVCLMTGKVVNQYTTVEIMQNGTARNLLSEVQASHQPSYTNIQIAMTVTFTVAVIQLAMYVLRLGLVSQLLSETLVNGFTCASAFHVVASQLKDLLGLDTHKRRGNFSFIYTIYDSILAIPRANTSAVTVSVIACTALLINDKFVKPLLAKKTKIPFPIELLAVVIGTTASYFMKFTTDYQISVVGTIPTGFPQPTLPAFELIPEIFLEAFIITMVSYTITMSMALIFARKLMYEVDSNQELLALGLSNTMGSFFSCMPVTASLSRSMIQQAVGGVTQLASIVSCCILAVILLWIGPFFETLPRCVLASIIVVALQGMLRQCTSSVRYWRLSRWDGIVWIVTFVTTLFVQISYGLAAGVAISLLSIFMQGYKPYTCMLGEVPNTDLYLDIKRYKGAREIEGMKIFHYAGGLSFASRSTFKDILSRKTGFDAAAILRRRAKMAERGVEDEEELLTKCLILDFSCLTFVDPAGVDFLRTLQTDLNNLNVSMYIAGCSGIIKGLLWIAYPPTIYRYLSTASFSWAFVVAQLIYELPFLYKIVTEKCIQIEPGPVYEVMKKCDKVEKKENNFLIFPTVHDAVLFAEVAIMAKKHS